MQLGQVIRAKREDLIPGTVIDGFTDYGDAMMFILNLSSKMKQPGEPSSRIHFSSIIAERAYYIDNDDFRIRHRFYGREIKPERALIIPTDVSFVPRPSLARLQIDGGMSFLLRYILKSTGKDRYHVVECSLFRELGRFSVEAFAREYGAKGGKRKVDRLIEQTQEPFAQRVREGLAMLVLPPR